MIDVGWVDGREADVRWVRLAELGYLLRLVDPNPWHAHGLANLTTSVDRHTTERAARRDTEPALGRGDSKRTEHLRPSHAPSRHALTLDEQTHRQGFTARTLRMKGITTERRVKRLELLERLRLLRRLR